MTNLVTELQQCREHSTTRAHDATATVYCTAGLENRSLGAGTSQLSYKASVLHDLTRTVARARHKHTCTALWYYQAKMSGDGQSRENVQQPRVSN